MKFIKAIIESFKDVFKAYSLVGALLKDFYYAILVIAIGARALIICAFGVLSLILYVVLFPLIVIRKMRKS